jgi:3-oxoacyl-[acyl-carrier-protein] synthase II
VMAIVVSKRALADSGIVISSQNRHRVGVVFGTAIGSMEANENFFRPLIEEGPHLANPAVFPNTVYNAAAGHVAMQLGTVGPTSTVTSAHAAGAQALCYASDLVAYGWADAIICVAADVLTEAVAEAYAEIGIAANRPGRLRMSEAGAALVVERRSAARARGARIYAEVLGYAMTSDARGLGRWARDGDGLERAMRQALERAGAGRADVDVIWTNAAGLWAVDRGERRAIERIFGNWPRLAEPKRVFGEPLGAGPALAAVLAAEGVRSGYTHPGFVALINACSLGGSNIAVVLGTPRG